MRHPRPALATVAVGVATGLALWSGMWTCPSAKIFHVPCPGCGSTRAMRALLSGDFRGVLLNPFAPLVSLALGLLFARAIWLHYTDGDLRRLDTAWGNVITRALVFVAVAELVLWIFRWFGFFGGPVPV